MALVVEDTLFWGPMHDTEYACRPPLRQPRLVEDHMGGCQNYGPRLGPLNTRCRIILRNQKGTMILTTTHMSVLEVVPLGLAASWGSFLEGPCSSEGLDSQMSHGQTSLCGD